MFLVRNKWCMFLTCTDNLVLVLKRAEKVVALEEGTAESSGESLLVEKKVKDH